MKAQEFPKLEEYETPEREKEMEQKLPKALSWSLNFFLERYLFLLKALQSRENLRVQVQQVKRLNRAQAHDMVLEQVKGGHYLEALAVLDISARYLELDIDALDYIADAERDTKWREERKGTVVKRDILAYHRDRVIEKEPRLRKEYTKKDFENWVEEMISSQQSLLKEEIDEDDRSDLLERISVLNKALISAPLSKEDISTLLFEIDYETALYREGLGEVIVNYLLGKNIQESQLLDYLGNIIKFRQFKVGVESGEWVLIDRRA